MKLYKEEILDHYKHPKNFGDLSDKTCEASEANASCGDMLEMYFKVEKGIIKKVKFKGVGCAISTAAASMLTEEIKGKKVKEVLKWKENKMEELMGEVNVGRIKCVELAFKAMKKGLEEKK